MYSTIQQMTYKKQKRSNSLNWGRFIKQTQKRYRKSFHKHIRSQDIKKIWDTFLEMKIIAGVLSGDCVKIDKYSTIQVIGTPILNDKRFFSMLMSGKMVRRDGLVKLAKQDPIRKDVKYKIVYKHTLGEKKKILFKADVKFARRVREALNNTNTYYKIDYVNK